MATIEPTPNAGSPEFRLLCCLTGPRPDEAEARAIVESGPDWDALLDMAGAHGVRPLLLRELRRRFRDLTPETTKAALRAFQSGHLARSLLLMREFRAVADALSAQGIRFVPFKGLALACQLYGDPSWREFNDLDILISERDLQQAEAALAAAGYRPRHGDREYRRAFLAYQNQYMLVKEDIGLAVDLHWEFCMKGIPFPITAAETWDRLETDTIAGAPFATLGRSDLAIYLAGHGAKEGWKSLGWVCDFAHFLDRNPGLDWSGLHDRAAAAGCGRPILLAHELAARVFGVIVAPGLLQKAAGDRDVVARAGAIHRRLNKQAYRPMSEEFRAMFELCETRGQKARALLRLLSTRTDGDYKAMPLPQALWPLYRLTRPFRLAGAVVLGK
jgi:hypothetical protein